MPPENVCGRKLKISNCQNRGTFFPNRQEYFHKLPGETFFNVSYCKAKWAFCYHFVNSLNEQSEVKRKISKGHPEKSGRPFSQI
ncbi:hypothetical protein M2137_001299 [Parabacteroides sp. PFB2-10]|nr:hypothetical protein [Parabacteroides sp. PFB2-10]